MKYRNVVRVGRLTVLKVIDTDRLTESRRKRHVLWARGVRQCFRCGGELRGPDLCTLEHVVALAEGGANTLKSGNLSLSHNNCNQHDAGVVSHRLQIKRWLAKPRIVRVGIIAWRWCRKHALWLYWRVRNVV